MPLFNPFPPAAAPPDMTGPLGFFGAPPMSRPGTYTAIYTPMDRALPAYTANTQASPYVGGLLDLLSAARLADLNTLRGAVENLRNLAEATTKQHNALVTDLKALGLIG